MKRCLLCAVLCLCLCGCEAMPFARELEATMLVQVLGVDWTPERVVVTAASDPKQGNENATAVLSATGNNIDQAQNNLDGAGEEYVSFTHVAQLVLGADTPVRVILEAAMEEPTLGQGATVWVVEDGSAMELLKAVDGGARRLSSIQLNGGVESVTVLQALMRLEEHGQIALPRLTLKEKQMVLGDTIIIKEEAHGT